ncbi:MAG: radical SAM protein [Candidatus Aminicenantes bacterium]|nr:MAG: radical SAM protein [Candidatus Aminicenantes bacterium]
MKSFNTNSQKNNSTHEKILLGLLPYWTPLTPPMGISCLKSFLQQKGYEVKTVDLNVKGVFRNIYDRYHRVLKECIPGETRGNFYNTGYDVLQNHMMLHLNCNDEEEYRELFNTLIFKNYLCCIDNREIEKLKGILDKFYLELETQFIDILEKEKPTILGLSVLGGTFPTSMFAFRLTRERYPHIKTVMGGAIFSEDLALESENFKNFLEKSGDIDKILVGEGENLFLKLLRNELPGDRKVYTLKDIDNQVIDLSSLKALDFSDFHMRDYVYLASFCARSCPFQCSFCVEIVYWGKYRKREPKQVVEEMIKMFRKYKRQLFFFYDSLLNPILTDLAREFIEAGISLYWDGCLRVDQQVCNFENTMLWRRGGFYRARIGAESGSSRVLTLMNKKITPRQIKDAISNLAEAGIKTTTYWLIGHPEETEEDFQQTLDLVEALKDDIYQADCNPFRYFETGQADSGRWARMGKKMPLYQQKNAADLLITQTWSLDCQPCREITMERLCRFIRHCQRLGIPNPYSLHDIYKADKRWEKLHKNSVPAIIKLTNENQYIDENQHLKEFVYGENKFKEDGDFSF